MKKIINAIRSVLWKIMGVPMMTRQLAVYYSAYPDGKLEGKPEQIGYFSVVDYSGTVKIGKNVKIGYGVKILSLSTITGSKDKPTIRKPVIIGDDVEIGSNSVIMPGVTIGENSTIGAGAVVTKDIPPNSIAVGIPAKVIKTKTAQQKKPNKK
jgi:acetyltransferase-like isoleucine patch superfamily enzyme